MRVGVIGLGKLGFCTAACFAKKHEVHIYDKNDAVMAIACAGRAPIDETGIEDFIKDVRLVVEESITDVVQASEVILIVVPTPSTRKNPCFDTSYVEAVLGEIAPALAQATEYKVIDVVSTVMPMAHRRLGPLLGGGSNWGYVYNPEFIALGSVLHDFMNPDLVLIGESDERAGHVVERLYRELLGEDVKICRTSILNAEIAKLSINCYVTMKISFANQLALFCENSTLSYQADAREILAIVGNDSRVGRKYLRPGLGFGGPCFPRDNRAFQAASVPQLPTLAVATDTVAQWVTEWVVEQVAWCKRVLVLGATYKPNTHVTEDSRSLDVVEKLRSRGVQCIVHDPAADLSKLDVWSIPASSPEALSAHLVQADAILVMTEWPMYRQLDWSKVSSSTVVLDMWGFIEPCGTYRRFGVRP